jgi:hypothetical protein
MTSPKKLFREGSRRTRIQIRAGRRLQQLAVESHHLPRGSYIHAVFFLLVRFEPPVRPMPEMDGAARQGIHSRQALRALEIHLGVVVKVKHCGVPVTAETPAAFGQEFRGQRRGIIPVHTEFDGCFGEGMGKVLYPNGQGDARHDNGDRDDPAIRRTQSSRHGSPFRKPQRQAPPIILGCQWSVVGKGSLYPEN